MAMDKWQINQEKLTHYLMIKIINRLAQIKKIQSQLKVGLI